MEQDRQSPDPARDDDERRARGLLDVLQRELAGEETLIAGRYVLGDRIGAGAHGSVHAAIDRLTGERVAVKLLPPAVDLDLVRLRGEIAALRLLRLPGVVHLFDEGVDHGRPFLVMERVDGVPFPGALPEGATRWTWEALRGPTLALLDTLARVHAAGLVHRDLKPRNVLVTAAGRPMLLDFGLTVGRALAEDSASDTSALGTPAYAAPEQVRGEPADARADLYSLGVMLWEALAGRRPHEGPRVSGILRARLAGPVESIERAAQGVPREVAEVVDALLEVERDGRPRSAVEVGERLRGEAGNESCGGFAFVGRDAQLLQLLHAIRAKRSACVVGLHGSGRTRLLREVSARWAHEGGRAVWVEPGTRPFESLGPLEDWLDEVAPASLTEARAASTSAIRSALGAGVLIVADDFDQLDGWSREALIACQGAGALLASAAEGAGVEGWSERVELGPLPVDALRELFAGSDRLQHVHEDAARELWERTAGVAGSVAAEIEGWRRAGLVEPSGAQLVISRASIDRLCGGLNVLPVAATAGAFARPLERDLDELLACIHLAWPNTQREMLAAVADRQPWLMEAELDALVSSGAARHLGDGRLRPLRPSQRLLDADWLERHFRRTHATLAEALAPGATGRLYHLVASGQDEAAAREAVVAARDHVRAGRLGDAEVALAEGLRAARRASTGPRPELELAVIEEWLPVAFGAVTPIAADRLLYEIGRSAWRNAELDHLGQLLRVFIAAYESDGSRALVAASAVPEFSSLAMERWRQGVRVLAARRCTLQQEELAVADACAWADGVAHEEVAGSRNDWEGRLRYRQGRYREAADLYLRAASHARAPSTLLSSWLNAASALMEAQEFARCSDVASGARRLAASCRHALFEGRAEWLARAAAYRSGEALSPDVELVDALDRVGSAVQTANVAITEAAIAWRAGEKSVAGGLAARAVQHLVGKGHSEGVVLARCLELAADGRLPDAATVEGLQAAAAATRLADVGLQALALLGSAGAPKTAHADVLFDRLRQESPTRDESVRLDVLSIAECRVLLRRGCDGSIGSSAGGESGQDSHRHPP